MGILELLLIAVGLSMDAFAVSICKGLSVKTIKHRHYLCAGCWFGGFQAIMPVIGYYIGISFASMVSEFDHWIAFVLLSIIGINMIREAVSKDNEDDICPDFSAKAMLILAIATSIDALAVGVSFAFIGAEILSSALIIGITTFMFAIVGLKIGNYFGNRFKSKAEITGGGILILIGLKILLEHTIAA